MNRDIQKLKAILSVAFIYVPVILFVLYIDIFFTLLVFDKYTISTWSILISSIFWLYIQVLIIFFYYRCAIGIIKIFKKNKDFFLR